MPVILRLFAYIVASVLLCACAASGDQFKRIDPPPTDQAVIYIFRTQHAPRAMDLAPAIVVGETEVGALKLDGYLRVEVPPGATEVRMTNRAYMWPNGAPVRKVMVNARAGETHFVEFAVESATGMGTNRVRLGVSLREVSQNTAMQCLPGLRYSK